MNTKAISSTLILLIVYYFLGLLSAAVNAFLADESNIMSIFFVAGFFGLAKLVLAIILTVRFIKLPLRPFKLLGWALLLSAVVVPLVEGAIAAVVSYGVITASPAVSYLNVAMVAVVALLYAIALMMLRKVGSITPRFNLAIYLLLLGFIMPLVIKMLSLMQCSVVLTGALGTVESLCCLLGYYFLFRNPEELISACQLPQQEQ